MAKSVTQLVREYQEARKARLDLLEEFRSVSERLEEAKRIEANAMSKVAWCKLPAPKESTE